LNTFIKKKEERIVFLYKKLKIENNKTKRKKFKYKALNEEEIKTFIRLA
jgi:hypothetical protein